MKKTIETREIGKVKERESHSVTSDSLRPHGLYSPWSSPGQNTGVGSLFLLQGNLPNPGIEPRSLALQVNSLPSEPPGKPRNTGVGSLSLLPQIFLTSGSPAFLVDSLPAELPGKPRLCSLRLELRTFTLWDWVLPSVLRRQINIWWCINMDCSPPGSSVHGILQERILEWVAIPFSKGSSRPMNWTWVSCIAGRFFTDWATGDAQEEYKHCYF